MIGNRPRSVLAACLLSYSIGPLAALVLSTEQEIIDHRLASFTDSDPGCVSAILRAGQPIATGAAGMASLEFNVALSTESILHVGSLSKQFIAATAYQLSQEGRLNLSASVTEWIVELPDIYSKVKVDHLFRHTSGIRDYLQLRHHAGYDLHESPNSADIQALLSRQTRLDFVPGTENVYSNSNYLLLQWIIERIEQQTLGQVLERRWFQPLGMTSTRFLADNLDVVRNRSRGYKEVADGGYRLHEPSPDVGGLWTSLKDLTIWATHIRALHVSKDPMWTWLTTPVRLVNGKVTREAAGLQVDHQFGHAVVEHSGSNRGFNAHQAWYPDDDLFVLVLCNVRQGGATQIAHDIATELLGGSGNKSSAYPKLSEASIERLAPYAGAYSSIGTGAAVELEIETPYAVLTLYGKHPSDSRTGSNVLKEGSRSSEFVVHGLTDVRLSLRQPNQLHVIEPTREIRYLRRPAVERSNLEEMEGIYRSVELQADYQIRMGPEGLQLSILRFDGARVDRGQLTAVTPEFFVLSNDPVTHLYFQRNPQDRVEGLLLGEPRLNQVQFKRRSASDH